MPNQGNKSNGKSGIVQPKKKSTMPSTQKHGAEEKATRNNGGNTQKSETGNAGNVKGKPA